MSDIVERLRERPFRMASETEAEAKERRQREREEGAAEIERLRALYDEAKQCWMQSVSQCGELTDEIERLRAALREMAQEDATNARRMRTAIVLARKKLDISRPMWTGPILQADGILEQALTVNNDRAALEGRK